MNPQQGRRRARTAVLVAGAIGAILALTGCVNVTPASKTPNATSRPSARSTPTPTPAPTSTAPTGTPVTIGCGAIFTAQQVYDFNPNYVAVGANKPSSNSLGAQVLADNGRDCAWLNETSNATLEIGVARPTDLATLKTKAASTGGGVAVATGATGYFHSTKTVGQFQVFTGSYWIVISGAEFAAATDAEPIARVVLDNLPAG